MAYTDLLHVDGAKNIAGIAETHYFAPIAEVLTFPKPIAVPVNPGDTVVVTDDFVMKTGKKFNKLYCTMEAGEMKEDSQGDFDGQSFAPKVSFWFPGSKKEALEFAHMVNNSSMVFIVVENNGQKRILGSPELPAKAKVSTAVGKKTADRKGVLIEVMSYSETPCFIYEGDVPLTPAA